MDTVEQKAEEWLKSQNISYSDATVRSLAKLLRSQDRIVDIAGGGRILPLGSETTVTKLNLWSGRS